jgi:hypothetical protein
MNKSPSTSPTGGTRSFRHKTSLAVRNNTLVVTDRKGTQRTFPLNAGPTSPTKTVLILPEPDGAFRDQWAILDGNAEALVIGYVGDWDTVETEEINLAAGLGAGIENRAAPRTELRHDGLFLQDGVWWRYAPHAGSVAFVVALITQAGFLPAALGWPLVAALMAFLVLGMTSGAYSKHRHGKGDAVEAAILAGDEDARRKAFEEALNQPDPTETEPPGAAT